MPDTHASSLPVERTSREQVVVRFAGDSGDGMQLSGGRFTVQSALVGNDVATFPDYPAEIRAPRGTTFGVSAFQVQIAGRDVHTPGDLVDALVAMNPAALKTNLADVQPGGIVIVDEDEFTRTNLKKCGYPEGYSPLNDEMIASRFRLVRVPLTRLVRESLADSGMGAKDVDRCRNMFALGVVSWLFDRPLEPTVAYLQRAFAGSKGKPEIARANERALRAGWAFGETTEILPFRYVVPPLERPPGLYRRISGNEALAIGLATAGRKAGRPLFYGSYPITPASDLLHALARLKNFDVLTFQAEDEIAAVSAAIGASFAGSIGVTGSSGPGIALKSEAIGLAVMYELPLVIVDVQRAGPATGMPTKAEQADLLLALFGRASESPAIVLAPTGPADCFDIAIEAVRLAVRCMCPVFILSDAYVANGAEPWRLPDPDAIPTIEIRHAERPPEGEAFRPYARDRETLARPWALPGTPGLEHRVGGLEKQEGTGAVCYDPDNHDLMVRMRADKIARAAEAIPPLAVDGPEQGDVLLLGWGGTYGAIATAAARLRAIGRSVAHAHLRHLNPMPANLGAVLSRYERVLVPEVNRGQLVSLIRDRFLVNAIPINETKGRMFRVAELVERVEAVLDAREAAR